MVKPDNLLSAKELAEMLGMCEATLYRHLKHGPKNSKSIDPRQLPDIYIGRKRYWWKSSVKELMNEPKV